MVSFLLIGFIILVLIGIPISFVIGGLGFMWTFITDNELTLVVRRMYYGLDSFPLLAVPLFMLAAVIMNNADISRKMVEFANALIGRFKGGLALVNVLVSMIFAGMSGSSQADTAGVGGILMPAMKKEGYSDEMTCGVTCASSTIGVIIPPSIPMLIIGSVVSISIAGMFLGGLIPGILVGVSQMAVIAVMSIKYKLPIGKKYSVLEIIKSTWYALPALVIPVIVLGGIAAGVFTATEAGDICVMYALIVGFLTRELNIKKFWKILQEVALMASIPLLICSVGVSLGWIMAFENIPDLFTEFMQRTTSSATVTMLIIGGIVLIAGCFLDAISIIIIMMPILFPLVMEMGIDPIHFGVVFAFGSAVALITPPVGLCLFVASTVSGVSIEKIFKGTYPFLIVEVVIYVLIIVFPSITTWIPKLVM
jgi:C4-dicarboxylate transporter DctM subunit